MGDIEHFIGACRAGDESTVLSLISETPNIYNQQNREGRTGLMYSLHRCHDSLTRLLLAQSPDISLRDRWGQTSLHLAAASNTPLDILVLLARLASKETLNSRSLPDGATALDLAIRYRQTSLALHLAWLGADCRQENRNRYTLNSQELTERSFTEVSLQTWLEAGERKAAQYWAVAANDVAALERLEEEVRLDKVKLRRLARVFNHRAVWSFVTSLQSLAWHQLQLSSPTAVLLQPEQLLQSDVPGHIVKVLNNCKASESPL